MRDKLVRCVAGLGMFLASSVTAHACANELMFTFFLHKNPEARAANAAILEASETGELTGQAWDKSLGLSLHAWRAQKTDSLIEELQNRLNDTIETEMGTDSAHVFLMREFAWLDISQGDDGVTISRTPPQISARMSVGVGTPVEGPLIFTTRRVLDTILAGEMTFGEAVENGLVASNCGHNCAHDPYALLAKATGLP